MQGSLLHKDRIADSDDPLVEVLEANGAIIIGKSNTPEFGAGGNTFNECAAPQARRLAGACECYCMHGQALLHPVRHKCCACHRTCTDCVARWYRGIALVCLHRHVQRVECA